MTTARYPFTRPVEDWPKFVADSEAWKPSGFDAEMALRLAYYLDDQVDDLKSELTRKFPETHNSLTPVTIPLVRLLTQEQAKVFLSTTKLSLIEPGKEKPDPKLEAWWKAVLDGMGLALRLKRADCYTTLLRTAGLRIGCANGRLTAHVVFPQSIKAVPDSESPMDLDRAHGVAIEIASDGGVRGSGARRWEFWCARAGEEKHLIIEADQESGARIVSQDTGDPLRGPGGAAIVPIVLFTAHTEELGLFAMEGRGLVEANRGLNVLVTDIHHIAEQQGFGVMVVTAPAGEDAPAKLVRAPNTAISLRGGVDAKFINPSAPLAELVALADSRIKQAAVFRGLPAGSVSVEARAVASGVALQIEMRPLLEARADAIEVYREPMRRLWDVIRATHNAYRANSGGFLERLWARLKGRLGEISEDVEMQWTPGDIQLPVDDAVRLDNVVTKLKNRLCTRAEAIAELRGISTEDASKVLEAIDGEEGAPDALEGLDLGLGEKKQQLQAEPPKDPVGAGAAPVGGAEVVQDTALNGAQVQALMELVQGAVAREMPVDAVQAIIEAAFPAIRPELIARIVAAVKKAPAPPVAVPPTGRPQEAPPPPQG